ncbi:MAG: TIGR03617 family F420-dependent LLM class oxidoreductase [Actinomycetota bacterium]
MKVETVLPLGKLDPGLRETVEPLDLDGFYEGAQQVERLGYDRLTVTETRFDPFVQLALAAQATERIELASAVAIAFPRSPTVTAQAAWTLQKLSHGRISLGLGTQVRGHIQRRFGMAWSPAGPWLREYIQAVREVWRSYQTGEQPAHEGEHYSINLMVPLFDPGPLDNPDIPVVVAAVKPYLCRVAGEVGDGLRPHPICTPRYIAEVMVPAVTEGTDLAGRSVDDIEVTVAPLVATAPDEERLEGRIEEVRARVSFYASTPAYRPAFDLHGYGDLADELAQLSKAQRWDEMPGRIGDDVLHTYAVVGTYDEITSRLVDRYGEVAAATEFSIPVKGGDDEDRLAAMVASIRSGGLPNG